MADEVIIVSIGIITKLKLRMEIHLTLHHISCTFSAKLYSFLQNKQIEVLIFEEFDCFVFAVTFSLGRVASLNVDVKCISLSGVVQVYNIELKVTGTFNIEAKE